MELLTSFHRPVSCHLITHRWFAPWTVFINTATVSSIHCIASFAALHNCNFVSACESEAVLCQGLKNVAKRILHWHICNVLCITYSSTCIWWPRESIVLSFIEYETEPHPIATLLSKYSMSSPLLTQINTHHSKENYACNTCAWFDSFWLVAMKRTN